MHIPYLIASRFCRRRYHLSLKWWLVLFTLVILAMARIGYVAHKWKAIVFLQKCPNATIELVAPNDWFRATLENLYIAVPEVHRVCIEGQPQENEIEKILTSFTVLPNSRRVVFNFLPIDLCNRLVDRIGYDETLAEFHLTVNVENISSLERCVQHLPNLKSFGIMAWTPHAELPVIATRPTFSLNSLCKCNSLEELSSTDIDFVLQNDNTKFLNVKSLYLERRLPLPSSSIRSFVELMPNLESINLESISPFKELSLISNLRHLKCVKIKTEGLDDFSELPPMENIEMLDLDCPATNVESLCRFPKLKLLSLRGGEDYDIPKLLCNRQLSSLEFTISDQTSDLSFVTQFSKLKELSIAFDNRGEIVRDDNLPFCDLQGVESMEQLKYLRLELVKLSTSQLRDLKTLKPNLEIEEVECAYD